MKNIFIIYILYLLNVINSKILKENVIFAVNCGGKQYTDENGIVYEKDKYFDAGISSDYGLNYDISNTSDMDLYQTERWHSDTFTYSVPFKENGKFVIILKFSEVYFNNAGEKVFDVALGRKTVLKDIDIFASVGKAAAHDEYIEFELKNDVVYVNGAEARGAYEPKNKLLKIKFLKGSKDNPKINAILIFKGDIMQTDYAEKKKKLDELRKKKLQDLKKNLLIQLRHNPDLEFDEDKILNEDNDHLLFKEDPSFFNIFFTFNGMCIIASFLIFLFINYYIDIFTKENKKIKKE